MADDEGMVGESGAAGGEPLGEDPQVATVADVHRNPDDDDYPLDVAIEDVTTQDEDKEKEDVEDDEEDEEDEEEDEDDDEEDDEELDEMIKVSNVQVGNVA